MTIRLEELLDKSIFNALYVSVANTLLMKSNYPVFRKFSRHQKEFENSFCSLTLDVVDDITINRIIDISLSFISDLKIALSLSDIDNIETSIRETIKNYVRS